MLAPIEQCRFNMSKGLWETDPSRYVPFDRDFAWVVVAFPTAVALERGVS